MHLFNLNYLNNGNMVKKTELTRNHKPTVLCTAGGIRQRKAFHFCIVSRHTHAALPETYQQLLQVLTRTI